MRSERGFALFFAYAVLAVIALLATAFISLPMPDSQLSRWQLRSLQTLCLAETGLDRAIDLMRSPSFQANTSLDGLRWGSDGTGLSEPEVPYSRLTGLEFPGLSAQELPGGGYEADLDPVPGRTGVFWVQTAGYSGGANPAVPGAQSRVLEAYVQVIPRSPFRYSAFGDERVTMSGNTSTDSYDSSQGRYRSSTAGTEGDIGTNATSSGSITLSGNVIVGGDAFVGPGGNPDTDIDASANVIISGTRGSLPVPEPLPPVTIPAGLTGSGDLSISGNQTVTLPGGTYWYDDISISGNGRLDFEGPAVLYLSGQLSVSGNGIGTAGDLPPNLTLYVAGNDNVGISGNANFYGAIYAPESRISLSGNGALFGGVVGREVSISGNSPVHYDVALQDAWGDVRLAPNHVQVLSWSELD